MGFAYYMYMLYIGLTIKVGLLHVLQVEPKLIDVHWLCQGFAAKSQDPSAKMAAPPRTLKGELIKR